MKTIAQNINLIIISIIIMLTTFLIGIPIDTTNKPIIYLTISTYSLIYFIIKRKNITIRKIDILLAILTLSSIIPLIFKTYVSLSGTVSIITKYFCIFSMFLITKNECTKNQKYKNIFINIILISILILCIIGIDEITTNYLEDFKLFINCKILIDDEVRIGSLFSYPNTMAAVAGVGIFISIGYLIETKNKKIKLLYLASILIMLITFILTYSRLAYIIFILAAMLYALILAKKYNIKEKINKKIIIITLILFTITIIYIIIGLNIPDELEVKNEYQKILYTVSADTEYTFKFDVEATENSYIIFTEKTKYFDNIKQTQLKLESGTQEIKIKTQETTAVMYINIKTEGQVIINNAQMNNKELILKYKLLPTSVVQKVESISLKNKSAWERLTFISDALKEIKNNWIFGFGGNAWGSIQPKEQSYIYYSTDPHCFLIKVLLENGIVGFASCVAICIYIIKQLVCKIKETNIVELSVIMGITFMLLHSLLDFNLTIVYVSLIMALLLATISSKDSKVKLKYSFIINIVLVVVAFGVIYSFAVKQYYKNNTEILVVNSKRTEVDIFDNYHKLLPSDIDIKLRKLRAINAAKVVDYKEKEKTLRNLIITEKYIDQNLNLSIIQEYVKTVLKTKENIQENLEFALEYVCKTESFYKYNPTFQIFRFKQLQEIIQLLEENEYANKYEAQLKSEIEAKEECILNYEKCRYSKETVEEYKKQIEEIKGSSQWIYQY